MCTYTRFIYFMTKQVPTTTIIALIYFGVAKVDVVSTCLPSSSGVIINHYAFYGLSGRPQLLM